MNYKDGRSITQHYCKDCNKPITWQAIRCGSCATKITSTGKISGMKGKKHTEETKLKIKIKCTGKNNHFYGKHHTKKSIRKMLKSEGRKKWESTRAHTKNKKEVLLENTINSLYPNDYKYVGNGKIWIDGFNPDFINCNGQKKIIEFFGDYWHNLPGYRERDKRRLKSYRKYGYKSLIIWEHELKDINKVKNRIINFNIKGKRINKCQISNP